MRSSPITPTVAPPGSTAKLCQISRYEPGPLDLLDDDRVGLLQDLDAARGVIVPMMRTARPGPGERLAPHDLLGQAELLADRAHLVLEQVAQRLDELEVHVVGQAADVVVRLDVRVVAATRLDDVGVERALHEEPRVAEIARRLLEHADEQSRR